MAAKIDSSMSLFAPHQWTEDTRDALFEFTWFQRRRYGFYLFSLPMWIGLLSFLALSVAMAAVMAVPLYHTVVVAGRPKSSLAYLTGFGLYLPFWIWMPRMIMQAFHVQNKIVLFCFCSIIPTTSIFRITEAMFGFTPGHAQQSLSSFVLYFASPMLLVHDPKSQKHVKVTRAQLLGHCQKFLSLLIFVGFYQSLFSLTCAFPTLGPRTEVTNYDEWYQWHQLWNVYMWKDTACCATLFQLYLMAYGQGLVFITAVVTQRQAQTLMDNPMFQSQSPSEFWGKRWNSLVHECLKNGVYKPVRYVLGGSRAMAVFAAFVASGLFHEWILFTVFDKERHEHHLPLGTTMAFFVWQAALVSLEFSPLAHIKAVTKVTHKIPAPVRTILVIVAGIPLGHWFTDPYVRSDYFLHGQMTLFSILPIHGGVGKNISNDS